MENNEDQSFLVNNSSQEIISEEFCHEFREESDEWWEIHNQEYIHYVYKITNKTNNMFYYGIHSTLKSLNKEPINDGYWGSGTGIREAIRVEGVENFVKEIVEIFDTRQDVRKKEAEIVTIGLVKDPNCYNRVVGGGSSPLGKVCVILKDDPTSKTFLVDKEEYYNNRDIYRTPCDQSVTVKLKGDPENNWFIVTRDEYYRNKDKYETLGTGKVIVYTIDDSGKVDTNSIKSISVEEYYKHKNTKYITVGTFSTRGKVVVVDKDDPERKAVCMDIDDPRYKSGKFIGITKGIKQSKETIAKKTGENSGAFGSMWITNGKENKKIYDDNIPDGWRKGRVYSKNTLKNIVEFNKQRIENNKRKTEILNLLTNEIEEVELNPIFFRRDNEELITPEYLQSLYEPVNSWPKVSDVLGISLSSIKEIRGCYESLGYKFTSTATVHRPNRASFATYGFKNKCFVNKDGNYIVINKNELPNYLARGYEIGMVSSKLDSTEVIDYYSLGNSLKKTAKHFETSVNIIKFKIGIDDSFELAWFHNDINKESIHLLVNNEIKERVLKNGWSLGKRNYQSKEP